MSRKAKLVDLLGKAVLLCLVCSAAASALGKYCITSLFHTYMLQLNIKQVQYSFNELTYACLHALKV